MSLSALRLAFPTFNWLFLSGGLLFLTSACASHPGASLEAPSQGALRSSEQAIQAETRRSRATETLPPRFSSATTAFGQGRQALSDQQYEQAVTWLERAIQLDDSKADYYLWLGRAYGHQAEQAAVGEQFFLARKVRKNLERAVELNPELVEARLDLLSYYLQAPSLLGGSIEKAKTQAAEIARRDAAQGQLAWSQCEQAEEKATPLFSMVND